MASALRVLLTGFEPFGGSLVNPSQLLVQRLASTHVPGLDLCVDVLPVVGGTSEGSAWHRVQGALARHSPDAVIAFGEAHTRGAITVERLAVNLLDYRMPDNAGACVSDQPVVADGPAAYFTTLPARAMIDSANAVGVPCQLSLSAGTFLCNEIMYRALHDAQVRGGAQKHSSPRWVGFVHLPQLPEQRLVRPVPAAAMALEAMARGTASMLETLLRDAGPVSTGAPPRR